MASVSKYIGIASFLLAAPAISETVRQLDAHNHGDAQLSIVTDNNQIALTLESPAANMVGFEHLPKNTEQQTQIDNVKVLLGDYTNLFTLSAEADCKGVESAVHWTLDHDEHDEHEEHKEHDEHAEHDEHEEHKEHDEHKEHEKHGEHAEHDGHSEFEVEFLLTCQNIDKLSSIDMKLFDLFPALETIHVEAVFANAQVADALTPNNTRIKVSQ